MLVKIADVLSMIESFMDGGSVGFGSHPLEAMPVSSFCRLPRSVDPSHSRS